MMPEIVQNPVGTAEPWHVRLARVLFAFVCLQVAVVLIISPWVQAWEHNFFSVLSEGWRKVWVSPYFRGAVSGVGVVNLLVAFIELGRAIGLGKHTQGLG
jgi:hypothetical protein